MINGSFDPTPYIGMNNAVYLLLSLIPDVRYKQNNMEIIYVMLAINTSSIHVHQTTSSVINI